MKRATHMAITLSPNLPHWNLMAKMKANNQRNNYRLLDLPQRVRQCKEQLMNKQ